MELKSKRIKKIAVRHSKNKKTSCKLQSKKYSQAIRTTQPPANSTQADSEAILPNRIQGISLRAVFHMKQNKNHSQGKRSFASGKRGFHPCFCLPACCNCPVALSEFVTCFIETIKLRIGKFQEMQLQQEKLVANTICFANVGCSPTPRQHF